MIFPASTRWAALFVAGATLSFSSGASAGEDPDFISSLVVPASTVTKGVPKPVAPKQVASQKSGGDKSSANHSGGTFLSDDSNITVQPGVTQVAAISQGHINRLVTPFPAPEVMSSTLDMGGEDGGCGEVCIKDNVVYVTTDRSAPVTLAITEQGRQDMAIMLTLVPRKIPPRELTLHFEDSMMASRNFGSTKAKSWEESQPYVKSLTDLFRDIALGKVPQGYTLHKADISLLPVCRQPGMSFDFRSGQRMLGHHFEVAIGVVTNQSDGPLEFRETACGSQSVAAVAAWPTNMLRPGERAEVYLAKTRDMSGPAAGSVRPSLVR